MSGIGIALSAVSVAIAVGTAAASGAEASKSKKAAREAEKVAKKKMEEARKEAERMHMQGLSVDLQGYKAEQEASQFAAAQTIDAAQQGEGRGLAAAAGRGQMVDIEQQRAARLDKSVELQALEELKAKERQEASDKLTGLSLAEVEGAQQAAADSEEMASAYTSQAIQSSMQAVQGAANLAAAAERPSVEAGAAFDKNLASIPEEELKNFLASQSSEGGVDALDDINGMDLKAIRKAYTKKFTAAQLSDKDFLGKIYTPISTR
jgi:hypothetical protein